MKRLLLAAAAVLILLVGAVVAALSFSVQSNEESSAVLEGAAMLQGVQMVVHKSPTCGCCGGWLDVMRAHGAEISIVDTDDIVRVKVEHDVPPTAYSCHTTEVAGYAVEGHVPAEAVAELLAERPEVRGIALPGMPQGSPGMTGEQIAPFEVVAWSDAGTRLFGAY